MTDVINDNLVFVTGESTTGKSASLMNLKNQEQWMYLNCEAGKKLPFRWKGRQHTITNPFQVYEAFNAVEQNADGVIAVPGVEGIIVDSATFLMDMFESVHVLPAADTMKAWGQYAQFFKNLMQQYVARSTKDVVFTAHTLDTYNEKKLCTETKVPIKGSLKNVGLESFFSLVISTKRMELTELKGQESALLNITPQEEALGFKHVFQTQLTKETVHERIRGPMGMWDQKETFIDNDIQLVFNRLHEYYGTEAQAA